MALDQPPLPRPPRPLRRIVLGVFAVALVGGYSWIAYTDYQPGEPARDEVPATVRASPGGYRSFHFWHTGYHGGK